MNRYARQMILPQIGASGQTRLAASHALVVGAGGLGSPVLYYLAGAGVGQITIVDPDTVSLSNLHRQPLFCEHHESMFKAEAATETLIDLNPDIQITPLVEALTPATAQDLVEGADIILDCADSFAVSYILSDECMMAGKPLISASALGMSGYVGGFCGGAPSLRALFPELPHSAKSCDTAGVMGPVVGSIGAMQAQMALMVALGMTPSPLGQMLTLDFGRLHPAAFRFDNAPEPEGQQLGFVAPEDLSPEDIVFDLRGGDPAPGMQAAHPGSFVRGGDSALPDEDTRVILACATGLRAWRAGKTLMQHWNGPLALLALGPEDT